MKEKETTENLERLDQAIYRYLRKEYNLDDLFKYVSTLPEELKEILGDRLEELTLRNLTK